MTQHISTQQAVATWKVAHRFVLDVYRISNKLPREEHYGLIPKLRTSSVKIASNIVEGYARKSNEFYLRHLSDSQVALEETKYSLLVARDLGYIPDGQYDRIMADAEHISELLESLHKQLAVGAPAAAEPKLFGQHTGVRETFSNFWSWLKGGRERMSRRKDEPQVWIEEGPTYNYLDEARD